MKYLIFTTLLLILGCSTTKKRNIYSSSKNSILLKFPSPVDSVLAEYFWHIDTAGKNRISKKYRYINDYFLMIYERDKCETEEKGNYVMVNMFVRNRPMNQRFKKTEPDTTQETFVLSHTNRFAVIGGHFRIPVTYNLDWNYITCEKCEEYNLEHPPLALVDSDGIKPRTWLTLMYKRFDPYKIRTSWDFEIIDNKRYIYLTPNPH